MEFGTEEQQAEAVKDWWVNNRVPVIAGLVIGIVLMIAWSGYKSWSKASLKTTPLFMPAFQRK